MPLKSEAIKSLLKIKAHSDLAALYTSDMECQVNVAQDNGKRVIGEFHGRTWQGWTDGIQTWKMIRIPRNANTFPEDNDTQINFDISHAEAIGMTGWDWKNKVSKWVAYDFDAMTGHSDKHKRKLSEGELQNIQKIISEIDWITIRKSTGGFGLHVYVFVDSVRTNNHTEHAALGRAILGKLGALTGCDFNTKVDIVGQNMWVWHRKMTAQNGGLTLIKQGMILRDIPPYWQDHIKVITGERKKILPRFLGNEDSIPEQKFEDLASQISKIPIDDQHRRLLNWLEGQATGSWWDADHHMLVTHTWWLAKAHDDLSLRGEFKTNASGTEAPHDINCYAFPIKSGGWAVRRYSMGVSEAETWEQDSKGWTKCFLNTEITFTQAARLNGGIEDPSGGFVFNEADMALEAIKLLNGQIPELPSVLRTEKTSLKQHKDGRLVISIDSDSRSVARGQMPGWLDKKGKWVKLLTVNNEPTFAEAEGTAYDDLVRHLTTRDGNDAGWAIRGENGKWRREPLKHVEKALKSMQLKGTELEVALGTSILRAWTLVNMPFQSEYPGDRTWNERAAQLKYVPSQNDVVNYPTWLKILNHIGGSLDDTLSHNAWAKANGIIAGADYLKLWIASLFKEPLEPLPYLFLYGPQNSGKSIFHEAIGLLLIRGITRADHALINPQGFNDEISNSVACVIEEIDLQRDKNASNRIKDWVTAKELAIHPKGRTPYQIPNSTHWIQCANQSTACPVFPGDTRITMIHVPELDPLELIPKKQLIPLLEKEAPDFLAELLRLEIPVSPERLNVPTIATAEKMDAEAYNRTPLQAFIAENYHRVDGERVLFSDMYSRFITYLDSNEVTGWTKIKFGRELPPEFPKGRCPQTNQVYVGNISETKMPSSKPKLHASYNKEKDLTLLVSNGQFNPQKS